LKRRNFLISSALGGFGLALTAHKFLTQRALAVLSCPQDDIKGTQPLFRFVAVGDVGLGNEEQYQVAQAMNCYLQNNPYSLALLTGDNIYYNGEIEKVSAVFEKPYEALLKRDVRFHAVLGNHDIRINNGEDQLRYSGFNMQGRYYTFAQDPIQFFALDTNSNTAWEEQLNWLEENLANSQATWKIVYGHHPLYSSGMHGSDRDLIERLAPLFSRYQVQLYLSGHDHNYERTKLIDGTTYLVCGGGSNTRPVGHSSWTAHSASILSFAAFEVYSKWIKIRGIDREGNIFDRATIFNNSTQNIRINSAR
jgi:Calcineurin-like phosphoesterase